MLFDTSLERLEHPGRAGYPNYDVDIVSAELPCGAAWLATALLELGVPLWRPWAIDDGQAWTLRPDRRWQYRCPDSAWSRLVPGLIDGRVFRLRQRPVPRFGHHWPGVLSRIERRILFVRDPRDALYSAWRRALRLGGDARIADFTDWVREPFAHLPLTRAGYLQHYWQAWLNADDEARLLIVRFEDSKRDARACLRRILDFVELDVGARAIARACVAAEHRHAAHADRRLAQAGIGPQMLGSGIAEEWRSHFTAEMHAAVGTGLDALCARLGYAPCPTGIPFSAKETPIDPGMLAAAVLQHHPDAFDRIARLTAVLTGDGLAAQV
jgi:Sulfotransferase domain